MFVANVMLLPGQELREFTVSRPIVCKAVSGRAGAIEGYSPVGAIKGILAQARPDETERWRQLGHPVSHKIIMPRKPEFDVLPGDVFERGGRRLYNQTMPHDMGGIGHWTVLYCEERSDIN